MKIERAVWGLAATCLVAGLAVECSNKAPPPTHDCVVNSDCPDVTKQCVQGWCVNACNSSQDCVSPNRCVALPLDNTAGDKMQTVIGNICQVPAKTTCAFDSDCTPLFCGKDLQCRSQCQMDQDCPGGINPLVPQKCAISIPASAGGTELRLCIDTVQDAKNYDPVSMTIIASAAGGGGGSGSGAAGGKGGSGTGGKGGTIGSSCPTTPQTAFLTAAQGDANPGFTSGVGVRVVDRTLIFSGYSGPPIAGAGGASGGAGGAGGAGTVNMIFVQAFEAVTGLPMGPAAPLFSIPDGTNLYLHSVAVAPTGEIALLHGTGPLNQNNTTLYASFMTTTPASGTAGVQLARTVAVESAQFGDVGAFWSTANQQFVFYWKYYTSAWSLRIKKFSTSGTSASGDTSAVPTMNGLNDPGNSFGVGVSGKLFAVGYRDGSNGHPVVTLLDSEGSQVGGFMELSTVNFGPWIQVGGTSAGFAVLYQTGNSTNGLFLPKTADGLGIQPLSGAGGAGGAGGAVGGVTWTPFTIQSTATTVAQSFSISDEAGAGGVGTVYLEQNGASFYYVSTDGSKRYPIGTQISSAIGTQVAITNHHGSFSLSLYEGTKHATQVVASACPAP